ncbi:MAG: transaldolase [Microthrixaceae bacterium]
MTRLIDLYRNEQQSPWLDNLRREWLDNGELKIEVDKGIRGITSNPSIFQKAIENSSAYDDQLREEVAKGSTIAHAYWQMVTSDIERALAVLRPVFDASEGADGFVSVEVDPSLAHDRVGTEAAARMLHDSIDEPNLMVKIPATAEGVGAIATMIGEGRSINVTLIFSLSRYSEVIEAYLSGLEHALAAGIDDLSSISSVASFFISRVDTEIDKRLDALGTPEAVELKGKGAVAQGRLAYELFLGAFAGPRWEALAAKGARVQRPLWASTSTKNPAYPDTLYVDGLIAPDTVNTLPEATIAAFEDHGTLTRTIGTDFGEEHRIWDALGALVDLDDVGDTLERLGVEAFVKAMDELLGVLAGKAGA